MSVVADTLAEFASESPLYEVQNLAYSDAGKVPFRVGASPFPLSEHQTEQLASIGIETAAYFLAVQELYQTDEVAHKLLDRDKPPALKNRTDFNYLFIRPDLVVHKDGFTICEIETSPFGLGLADILNRSFQAAGYETMAGLEDLQAYLQDTTPAHGQVLYSFKTERFLGQLQYMAKHLLSDGNQREWQVVRLGSEQHDGKTAYYRGFYVSEFDDDIFARVFISEMAEEEGHVLPGLSSQMEEKAVLAFIWDKRYQKYFSGQLGKAAVALLQQAIPPTWIIGEEEHFLPGMPGNISSSIALGGLSNAQRQFVLKASGGRSCSWGKGVRFLHKKTGAQSAELLRQASTDEGLFIVQAFRRGENFQVAYEQGDALQTESHARVRLTPYFAMQGVRFGSLLAIKATARAGTELIHGSTDSINSAVAPAA